MEKKPRGRKALKITGAVALVLVIALAIYFPTLMRLYHAMTLFEAANIEENFRTMDQLFTARVVHAGDDVYRFKRNEKQLPATYTYNGQEKNIQDFLERTCTTGLIVVKDDTILFEKYYRGNDEKSKAITWSVVKSMVSALCGIAVSEGHIKDISRPVTDYVPMLKGSGYDGVPIKDILQMSSGVRFDEDYGDFNSDINRLGRAFALNASLDEFADSLESERKPGIYNHYVSMDTQVIGMLIREATGTTLSDYMEQKIWKPVGMESDATWLVDSEGMEVVFGGYNMVLRDYARFGRLYLKKGNWNGTQVVPAAWVKASVTPDAPHLQPGKNPNSTWVMGYGYQWWIPENADGAFMAIGVYGQAIYIYPKYNMVIAKTSAYPDYNEDGDDMETESVEVFRSIARRI